MTIQQLSKEVGIGVDTLRIWERRYGFPAPERDRRGHRRYSVEQVRELQVVKKLQSCGQRPGEIFALAPQERLALLEQLLDQQDPADPVLQGLVTDMTPGEIDRELRARMKKLGLTDFIPRVAVPMIRLLDRGWSEGRISIAREHLVSDCLEGMLKEQLAAWSGENRPTVLFLTLSGERHKLGLLMAAAYFRHAGLRGILLNEELPLSEIPPLATELQVAAVALSFSAYYPTRQAKHDLADLRKNLDPRIKLIAGGDAVQGGVRLQNLIVCTDLTKITELCRKHFAA